MTPDEFDACFNGFVSSVIRLETLQHYTVEEETPRLRAFLRGEARPERSVRTSSWLARIAMTTLAGKTWRRVHLVDVPLTDYLRYELASYVESQACGEQIRLAQRSPELAAAQAYGDFWLFDADTTEPFAIEMHYDSAGRWLGASRITAADRIRPLAAAVEDAWTAGQPLNEFLAALPRLQRARSA